MAIITFTDATAYADMAYHASAGPERGERLATKREIIDAH